jgi:hypothetical protein
MDQAISLNMSDSFENNYMRIRKESGILYCAFGQNLNLNRDLAQMIVKERIAFSKGISYPALIDVTGVKNITKEAREYMAGEGAELLTAGALLITSPVARVIGNLFLMLNQPKIPTRLFTSESEAQQWLQQFKEKAGIL